MEVSSLGRPYTGEHHGQSLQESTVDPGPDPDIGEPFHETGTILELIAEAISALFRLDILVRKASPIERFKLACAPDVRHIVRRQL